jgi:hypothetical protein
MSCLPDSSNYNTENNRSGKNLLYHPEKQKDSIINHDQKNSVPVRSALRIYAFRMWQFHINLVCWGKKTPNIYPSELMLIFVNHIHVSVFILVQELSKWFHSQHYDNITLFYTKHQNTSNQHICQTILFDILWNNYFSHTQYTTVPTKFCKYEDSPPYFLLYNCITTKTSQTQHPYTR